MIEWLKHQMTLLSWPLRSIYRYGLAASLLASLGACGTPATVPIDQAGQDGTAWPLAQQLQTEYRSNQVDVYLLRQDFMWQLPDASQHLAQFSQHVLIDGSTPVRLQDFVIEYSKPRRGVQADLALQPALMRQGGLVSITSGRQDQFSISRNGELLVSEAIAPAFTGEQGYRRLEVAKLKFGQDIYLLTVANSFLHRPMWLAIYGEDGKSIYRIGLPHGIWQLTEHADGISMLDTSGSGRRVVIHPSLR